MIMQGRAWVFPDANISTDLLMPSHVMRLDVDEQAKNIFLVNRPGWPDLVRPGDFIVAGPNFGTGSGRPIGRTLRHLGIAAIVAESVNGLFQRNAFNWGLAAVEAPGILDSMTEGDEIVLDLIDAKVTNLRTGAYVAMPRVPQPLLDLLADGGIFERLYRQGFIDWIPK